MEVYAYSADKHGEELKRLVGERGLDSMWGSNVPKASFCAYVGDKMVAFLGVREVEGGMGILESAVTDPAADSEVRNAAMDAVSSACVKYAMEKPFIGLLFVTDDKNTVMRGVRYGGAILNKVVVSRYFKD